VLDFSLQGQFADPLYAGRLSHEITMRPGARRLAIGGRFAALPRNCSWPAIPPAHFQPVVGAMVAAADAQAKAVLFLWLGWRWS
jgi:hypothetical protein